VAGADANNGSWVWAGIPYAKPPVGELRWKAPQDPEPWNKIRQSTYNFTRCTQPVFDLQWNPVNKIQGSEDCLYLNVFRPKTNAKNLPVYFWIHGGGNSFDGADNYDASILAQKSNMVVVVIQFRTGPFGWFNHPALNPNGTAEDKSGNYGVLDMIKALKWVNKNIAAFGGNPKNVTIAGESTGGYRVMNLMISPLAKGLFHTAINQSGGSKISRSTANDIVNAAIDKLLVMTNFVRSKLRPCAYRASLIHVQIRGYFKKQNLRRE
jgi:para-nitrobenzyl esterase